MIGARIFELWFPWTPDTTGLKEPEISKVHNRPLAQTIGRVCADLGWQGRQIYFTRQRKTYHTLDDNVENVLFPLSLRYLRRSQMFGHQVSIAALRHLATARLDCVAFFQAHGRFPQWGARICEARKIPYLVIVGGWYVSYSNSLNRYFGHALRFLAHTQMQLDALARVGHSSQNMEVFPIGVDTDLFTLKPREYYTRRAEWPRLLYVGRLDEYKGVVQAVQTFSVVLKHFPGATLKIIGSPGDQTTMDRLAKVIREENLAGRIAICSPMDNRDLVKHYQEADLFLFPSIYEGLPQVVLESMACGTPPIVIRASGGTEEAVIDGEVGWVVDMPRLAYDVLQILSVPDEIQRAGENAARHIREVYSSQRTYKQLAQILGDSLTYNRNRTPRAASVPS